MSSYPNYRAAVGPPELFDLISARQFCVLVAHGLREHHKLLDVGCGCLRGGKFLIPYLAKGNYYGVEPDTALVDAGIEHELGECQLALKAPTFSDSASFAFHRFSTTFDYILAQSILSHTDQSQLRIFLLSAKAALKPKGILLFTYFKGQTNYEGTGWRRMPSATYTPEWMRARVQDMRFTYTELNTNHPAGQTWVKVTHAEKSK